MGKNFLISGNDEFAIKDMARNIVSGLCGENFEDDPGLEIIRGDDESKKMNDILTELIASVRTPPFLSPNKIIWLRHFAYFDKLQSSSEDPLTAELLKIIKDGIPDDVTLILDGPGIDRRKAFYKSCGKKAEVHFMEKADLGDKNFLVNQFNRIKDFFAENKKSINDAAAHYLSETIGSDSARLKTELEKLICYTAFSKNPVSIDDCREVCSRTPEALSWAFADALIDRNTAAALDAINVLMEQLRAGKSTKNSELAILSFAAKRFQEIIKTKKAASELNFSMKKGANFFYSLPQAVKDEYPDNFLVSMHPFRAFKLCEAAMKFSDIETASAINLLLETNRKLVSGAENPRLALEQLAISITRKKKRAPAA
ncbi:MAG: hypothetical protein A2020_09600 [Lentisphaerae bacterium GWF2_45_14]|nr:MAG: hypothetical protein A2020_09600 [Lentisphaerae bacterium GWF2_45_14]